MKTSNSIKDLGPDFAPLKHCSEQGITSETSSRQTRNNLNTGISAMCSIHTWLFVCMLSISSYAQRVDNMFKQNIDIHIDPIPLGFPDPSLRFGSEMMMGNRWSIGMNLGVGFNGMYFKKLPMVEEFGKDYFMIDMRPELKFYWLKRQKMGWYISAEGLTSLLKSQVTSGSHAFSENTTSDTLQVAYDRADYKKTKLGLIGKVGIRHLVGQKVTVDFFTGLGLSRTNSAYSNYVNQQIIGYDPFFEMENFDIGKRVTPHISFGLRIGVIIWTKDTFVRSR